jgi:hypothetical protein
MTTLLLELEGSVEEIQERLKDFAGRRLRVIVRPADSEEEAEPTASPLDAALSEIWNSVPDTSWQQFPPDFGDNLDHYLYGTPKRT